MQVKITNPKSKYFGQGGGMRYLRHDVNCVGIDGADLCLVTCRGEDVQMLSTELQIVPQPEPKNDITGYTDKNGNPVEGGDVVVSGSAKFKVVWNGQRVRWELDCISGDFGRQIISNVLDMDLVL